MEVIVINLKIEVMKLLLKVIVASVIVLSFVGCERRNVVIDNSIVVYHKSHSDFWGDKMPDKLCRYGYKKQMSSGERVDVFFDDSCSFYKVGDTIVGRKVEMK